MPLTVSMQLIPCNVRKRSTVVSNVHSIEAVYFYMQVLVCRTNLILKYLSSSCWKHGFFLCHMVGLYKQKLNDMPHSYDRKTKMFISKVVILHIWILKVSYWVSDKAVSSWSHIASNGRMIREQWSGTNLEGSGLDLIWREELRETIKNLFHDIQFLGRDFNPTPTKYKAEVIIATFRAKSFCEAS
jgi:hypothetical protein